MHPGALLLAVVLGAVCWPGWAGATADGLFDRVEMLTRSGATELALRLLDEEQPAAEETEAWLRSEQLRISILARRGDLNGLAGRLDRIPAELPLIHQHRLLTHAVELLLASGEGARSRRYLRELIWRGSGDSTQIAHWRRLVIKSYLLDDLLDDARVSMARYQQEYAPTDQDWSYLYGLTLFRSSAYEEAAARLSLVQRDAARALMWLARLRAGTDEPRTVISGADALYTRIKLSDDQPVAMQRVWSLQAEAAEKAGDARLRVKALEKLFSRPLVEDAELSPEFVPEDLWRGYERLGGEVGNRENLLLGDTEAWSERAAGLRSGNKYDARAVYALLAMRASDNDQKESRHGYLYDLLRDADLESVAISLYTVPGRFRQVEELPHSVRHRMVRFALRNRDFALAAEMARDLTTTFGGQSPEEWKLIRARLAIYSGDPGTGRLLTDELIRARVTLPDDLADRILQLVFDLQNLGRHDEAIPLFRMIQERAQSSKIRREIFFWIAESLKGKSDYQAAAEYYIISAEQEAGGHDVWGQSARYHAAEALEEAGLTTDAREIYSDLLVTVKDPAQIMTLERKLQDLMLQEGGADGS